MPSRSLWCHYLQNNDALIFIVDSADRERLEEAREELWSLLEQDELRNTCVLVYANKQDLPGAANAAQVADALELTKLTGARQWYLQSCCATSGDGIVDGLQWVAEAIKKKKRRMGY